jgi:hypothetical protein
MFRVFKVEPPHGWGAVAWELAIVTLGVVIALAAQQTVESVNWTSQVADTREAVRAELEHDLGATEFMMQQRPCVTARLDQLGAWLAASRNGRMESMVNPIGRPSTHILWFSVWDIVKAGDVASHIPLDERLTYARSYAQLLNLQILLNRQTDGWATLSQFNHAQSLDHEDQMRLEQLLTMLRTVSELIRGNIVQVRVWTAGLHLKPERLNPYDWQSDHAFCTPLFGPSTLR